ncbi:MAG TPA: L,D-transpeptidase family protein [Gaiellaceae bacterium]
MTAVAPPPRRPSRRPPVRRRRSRKPLIVVAVLLGLAGSVAGGIAAYGRFWTPVSLSGDPDALAHVELAPVGVRLEAVKVTTDAGKRLPVDLRQRNLWPKRRVAAGTHLTVVVTVRRSGWLSWAAGKTAQVRLTATAPAAHVVDEVVQPGADGGVSIRFDTPVARTAVRRGGHTTGDEHDPRRRVVATGVHATQASPAGTLTVRSAPRSWETLGPPERVVWFPAAKSAQALVSPSTAARLTPTHPLRLTLSQPVDDVFGSKRPALHPSVPGKWVDVDDYTIEFVPEGPGFGLGMHVHLTLPVEVAVVAGPKTSTVKTLSWSVPDGSTLRLQQLLAQLHYLPLEWHPADARVALTATAQARAAIDPPDGRFTWRHPNLPQPLRSLWSEGNWTTMTQGAVMRFQHDNGLTVDGLAGPVVWRTLIRDTLHHKGATGGYSYVLVHRQVPQTLVLWHEGKVVLSARVNTGVAGAPTALGTWPVFLRASTTTMSGVNPDGSHYHDEGIRWVSYFHGGEAIHGFNRASYGYPQSVGCVEAPVDTAAKIWPYTPIGTLVTIAQ